MKEKITQAVAAVVTLGSMLWTPFGDWVNAAGGQAEIVTAAFALYTIIHGLIHYGGRASRMMVILLALMVPAATAHAQEPADRGGVLLAYNLTNLEVGMDKADGFTFEADVRVPQAPAVSIVGHVSSTNTTPGWTFTGIGPRATYDAGPIKVFAHWLVGSVKVGDAASDGIDHKAGAGVMIPLGRRWEIQLGGDHDGDFAHGRFGVGYRF